ncbi:MAG: EF-hand domain-containing protein [Syntrophales bacterium]|nr:EF-hand domain-containing protein [Syntrophales bacterium]
MVSGISNYSTASLSDIGKQIFSKVDTNGDGAIAKTEIVDLIQQNMDTIVNGIFGNFDTDQDGIISQIESDSGIAKLGQEMKNIGGILAASGSPNSAPPEKVFDTADTNKDGVVSKEELAALAQNGSYIDKLFSKVDNNSDGLISPTEGEILRKQIQQKETANSGANDMSGIGQGWKSEMFNSLLKVLSTTAGSPGKSTSLYT